MAVSFEDILNKVNSGKSEADFLAKLAETADNTPENTEVTDGPLSDEEKLASAQAGDIFAEAFMNRVEKRAAEKLALNPPTGITPNTLAVQQMNPGIQNSVMEDPRAPEVDKVVAILNSMVGDPTMPGTKTVIDQAPNSQMAAPASPVMGMQPNNVQAMKAQETAASMAAEAGRKTASHEDVVAALYTHFFGGE